MHLPLNKFIIVLFLLIGFSTLEGNTQNLSGKSFWFSMPKNYTDGVFQIIIISDYTATGQLDFPQLNESTPFVVTPGTPILMEIDPSYFNSQNEEPEPYGFNIKADSDIVVYAINYFAATEDAETVFPDSYLDTNFVVTSTSESLEASVTIIATEDNTEVRISTTRKTTTGDHNANTNWSVILNKGESYKFATDIFSPSKYKTLSGSRINSNKPIAVVGHTPCTDFGVVQYGSGCASCDFVMNQIIPMKKWGKKFVVAQAAKRQKNNANPNGSMADYVEMVAGPLGASLSINNYSGDNVFTIAPYGRLFYENKKNGANDVGEANIVINSDNPIHVTQYSKSCGCDWGSNPAQCLIDPEGITIFPVTAWTSSYVYSTSPTATSQASQLCIIIDTAAAANVLASLTIDNLPIVGTTWNKIGTSSYVFARINTVLGQHHVKSSANVKFGFYVYLMGFAESYVVQGGGVAKDLPCPIADFTSSINCPNELTKFKSTSINNNCSIVKYEWDFGDGTKIVKNTNEEVGYSYIVPGNYTATLKVTNNCNPPCSDSISYPVPLLPLPKAGFKFDINALGVQFYGDTTNNINKWRWDFGDRSPLVDEKNPHHNYLQIGSYPIILWVWNSCGQDSIVFKISLDGSSGGGSTGVEEKSNKNIDINIYPNPFQNEFTINLEKTNGAPIYFQLMDIYGRKIKIDLKNLDKNRFSINVDEINLNRGIYFLTIRREGILKTYKIYKINP